MLQAMDGRDRLTAQELHPGLPVILDGATEGLPVHRSEDTPPETWLQDGHPGRIKHWRYGLDHVIVEWFRFEDADVSDWVGFARNAATGTYGLVPIPEDEYRRRCAQLAQESDH
jgi:hypothetical protein